MASPSNKIISYDEMSRQLSTDGERLVVCYGHFNILHPGHFRYLEYARRCGDKCIVFLIGDDALSKAGGQKYFPATERANGLSALAMVDQVMLAKNETLLDAVKLLNPDVLVLGKEFEQRDDPVIRESVAWVQNQEGSVKFHAGETSYASSNLQGMPQEIEDFARQEAFNKACLRLNIDQQTLGRTVDRFADCRLMVVGDTIIDQFVACDALGMSAEAPVIVVRELDAEEFIGGAGIVAAHATALGAECHYLSVVGDDDNANWVQRDLDRLGVKHHLIGDPSRPTTFKIRYMVEKQKVFRVSRLKEHSLDTTTERALIAKFDQLVEMVDAVLISDFVYGVITSGFLEHIRRTCIERNLMLFGDVQCSSQVGNVTKFKGFNLICPTEREARISLGDSDNGIEWLAQELIQSTKCENLVIKLGSEGFIGYASDKDGTLRREHFPALVSNPVDVAGAGDSLLAAMAVAMSSGANMMEAAAVAANMAAISVSQLGNRPIKASQIKERMAKGYQLA